MLPLSSATHGTVQMDGCPEVLVSEEPSPIERRLVALAKMEWRLVALLDVVIARIALYWSPSLI